MSDSETIDIKQFALLLGVSVTTMRRFIERKTVPKPIERNGQGRLLWLRSDVDAFLKKHNRQHDHEDIATLTKRLVDQRLQELGLL